MKTARTVAACAAALVAIAVARRSDGAAENRERRFFSTRAGVGIEAPLGWTLSVHTGYPNVLCILMHPSGSRISLAVDTAVSAQDAAALAAESRPGLAAQGIEITAVTSSPRGGVLVDEWARRRNQALRQLYLVRAVAGDPPARQAIVLTLTTTPPDLAAASGAFDLVIARLDLEAPVRPETPVRPDKKEDKPPPNRDAGS